MKKIILILFVLQSVGTLAQTETEIVVTPNGKKITIKTNPVRTADNGLNLDTPTNVQLGGSLIANTSLIVTPTATFSVTGLQGGNPTDDAILADNNGILRTEKKELFQTEPWYQAGSNTLQATANDQNIYHSGMVGIGTSTPAAMLHIKSNVPGAIKINDGTEQSGAILTSRADGTTFWKKEIVGATILRGVFGGGFAFTNVAGGNNAVSNDVINYIDLPEGSWAILMGFLLAKSAWVNNSNMVARFGFSPLGTTYDPYFGGTVSYNSNTTIANFASYGNTPTTSPPYSMFCQGTIIVTTTQPTTRLYLWNVGSVGGTTGGACVGGIGGNAENYMYAIKINKQ